MSVFHLHTLDWQLHTGYEKRQLYENGIVRYAVHKRANWRVSEGSFVRYETGFE